MTIPYIPSKQTTSKVIDFSKACVQAMQGNWNLRPMLESMDRSYARENDRSVEGHRAKAYNDAGDIRKFQNIIMPVLMPQVEQCVAYQQSVFLTGTPIFSCVSVPEFAEAAAQLDTIFAEQEVHGNWSAHLLRCIRDGLKYNLMAAEVDWHREKTVSLQTDIAKDGGKEGQAAEINWEGNRIRHLDMYNTFWDTRVKPSEVASEGEFAGFHELMGRVRFKKFVNELPMKINAAEAFKAGAAATTSSGSYEGYYFPRIKNNAFVDQDNRQFNWASWAGYETGGGKLEYRDSYLVTTLYARIMPAEFNMQGIPGPNTPQVWKFIIINGEALLYAERCTNAHNLLPIIFSQILDDGLGYQTKSFAENLLPFQAITTALANSSIASRRRAISDRTLFDPSRVSPAAINNDNPSANIPVRPSAYGRPLNEAVYPFPFRDDQFQINMAEIQSYLSLANTVSGLNPARQGQFVKGNKTKFEYADVMANANGRDMAISLMLESNFFTPIKHILKINVLQYQQPGKIPRQGTGELVQIDPVALRKAVLVLKVTDGLTPSDKIIDGETLSAAVQTFTSMPQIGAEYNMGDMVSYLFSSRGLKLAGFKKSPEQIAYEQAVGQWQQAIGMVAQEGIKQGMDPAQLQEALASLPQPTPEQFNYTPGVKASTPGTSAYTGPSVLASISDTITQTAQSAQQAQQAQPAQGQSAQAQGTQQ